MTEQRKKYYKGLFLVAAIYDIVLGIVFTFFYGFAFKLLGITDKLPNYGAYLSLIGSFLFVIGIAYYLIYKGDLKRNRSLIIVGALYKFAFASVAIWYFAIGEIPHVIFASLFGVVDLIMLFLMIECLLFIGKNSND